MQCKFVFLLSSFVQVYSWNLGFFFVYEAIVIDIILSFLSDFAEAYHVSKNFFDKYLLV